MVARGIIRWEERAAQMTGEPYCVDDGDGRRRARGESR